MQLVLDTSCNMPVQACCFTSCRKPKSSGPIKFAGQAPLPLFELDYPDGQPVQKLLVIVFDATQLTIR
jgi:hypothetical protein